MKSENRSAALARSLRKWGALLLSLTLCLSLSACGPGRPEPPDDPVPPAVDPAPQPDPAPDPKPETTIGELSLHKTYSSDAGEELLNVSVTAPKPEGTEAAEQIAAYYQMWMDDIDYYCETMLTETSREALAWARENGGTFTPYALESGYQVTRSDDAVFSVIRDQYESTGGVHPSYAMLAETFDAANGGRMSVFTLFSAMEEQDVLGLIHHKVAALAERRMETQPDLYYENYRELLADTFDPLCFALTDTGLTLYWQTYSIGPFVSGVQRCDIPYEELEGKMDEQWMLS